MDFRRIQIFAAAAEARSFTQAAGRLHLSQSAVSQQVKLLEAELGEVLFHRGKRAVRLSPAGERVLLAAHELISAWDTFLERAQQRDGIVGRLAVGASGAATVHLWSAIYNAFGREYPGITLDLKTTESTEESISQALSGDLDIALAVTPRKPTRVEMRVLGVHEALLCVPPSHPLANRRLVTAGDLKSERFLLFERPISIRWLAEEFFEREGVTPHVVLESNDAHLIRAMIEVGYGIGFLPDWSIQRELKERRLRVVRTDGPPLAQKFGLVFDPRTLTNVARAFIEFCQMLTHLLPATARINAAAQARL
jgi:DNA-binding transcriptional LysR family regulator